MSDSRSEVCMFKSRWGQSIICGASLVAQTVNSLLVMRETQIWFLVRKIPGEGNSNPLQWLPGKCLPPFLPGKSHRQKSLVGYSPQGRKEKDMTESLNNIKENICGSVPAWKYYLSYFPSKNCFEMHRNSHWWENWNLTYLSTVGGSWRMLELNSITSTLDGHRDSLIYCRN